MQNMIHSRRNKQYYCCRRSSRTQYNYLKSTIYNLFSWKESDTIRFLYSGQFNFTKCLENIKKHINWLMDPFYHGLTTQSQRMLVLHFIYSKTDGMIYQFGVDKKMRPVIYFNIRKINAELKDVDSVIQAICFLLT